MAETELWLVDLETAASALESIEVATPRLSDDVDRRLAGMADETARRERRLAHIALRILIERMHGPSVRRASFATNAAGKPSLVEASNLAFSLAHTAGMALVAVSGNGGPLGVDIERLRPVRISDARRAPIERRAVALAAGAPLAGPDADARFLSAWVRIEAASKAHGGGVGPDLERLRPNRSDVEGWVAGETPGIVAHDVPMARGVFAAVALAAGREPPPLRELPQTAAAIDALLAAGEGTRR